MPHRPPRPNPQPPERPRRRLLAALAGAALAACAAPPPPAPPPESTATPEPTATPPPTPGPSPTPAPPAVRLADPSAAALPLAPLAVAVDSPGLQGPAELRLTDSRGRPAGAWPLQLGPGAQVTVLPRGALGPQRAELVADGAVLATADPLFTLDARTAVETGLPRIDGLYPQIRGFMEQCRLSYVLDGRRVSGYRSPDNPLLWLRDHTYQARGFRHFERDLTSLPDAFRAAQRPDGSLPDWLAHPEIQVAAGRKEVEADVEFLFVQAVVEAWQATGDDEWLRACMPAMRRALDYTMSDGLRWDAGRGLVKRAYTIDMWDFSYGPTTADPSNGRPAPRHWLDSRTVWGTFHGDSTGLAHALDLLALAEERLGDPAEAVRRRGQGDSLMARLNGLHWNGSFYTHFIPLEPFDPPGVDAAAQLSLSNAYALNRGVLSSRQGRAIVDEYFDRGARRGPHVFAEWYSIDPPFPAGSFGLAGRPGEKPGEYVNGGLMPLVGGELARGAFRHGAEAYGFAILDRYHFLISSTGATYLWYYPEGNPGISGADTLPTDGWGASAMLAALVEGAAGLEDRDVRYRRARHSPRWAALDDASRARAVARYAASDGYAAYRWERGERAIRLEFTGSGDAAELRVLLPKGVRQLASATLDGQPAQVELRDVSGSRYAALDVPAASGTLELTW